VAAVVSLLELNGATPPDQWSVIVIVETADDLQPCTCASKQQVPILLRWHCTFVLFVQYLCSKVVIYEGALLYGLLSLLRI
jgi:hypothetical protein